MLCWVTAKREKGDFDHLNASKKSWHIRKGTLLLFRLTAEWKRTGTKCQGKSSFFSSQFTRTKEGQAFLEQAIYLTHSFSICLSWRKFASEKLLFADKTVHRKCGAQLNASPIILAINRGTERPFRVGILIGWIECGGQKEKEHKLTGE